MYRFLKYINPFYTGLFFLNWAMISFFIFGTTYKYLFLSLGFLLIIFAAFISPNKKGLIKKIFIFLFFYVIFLLLSIFNEHNNLNLINFIYGLICLSLIISGSIISKNHKYFQVIPQSVLFFYSMLVIFGTIFFQIFLLTNSLSSREFQLESEIGINTIGLAFTTGVLFLMFFSIIYSRIKINYFVKIFVLISFFCCLLNLISTLSRGALVFIILTFLIIFFKKLISKQVFKILFILIFVLIAFNISLTFIIDYSPVLGSRIDNSLSRFESLFSFTQNQSVDLSSQARISYFDIFKEKLSSFILFGQYQYTPYPHNIFMEILMRFGLIGVPLILFMIRFVFQAIKYLSKEQNKFNLVPLTISVIFIFSFLQSFTSLTLEFNRILWLGFGFYYSFKK